MAAKHGKFEEDVPRLARYQGGDLPVGWTELVGDFPNINKARSKASWLYNVKRPYAKMSEVNAAIMNLRQKMLRVFSEVLRTYPPDQRYILASAVHLQASYQLDPSKVKTDEVWPLELQPDDGEMFVAPNGGFMWLTTPYPEPHPKFTGKKQSHVEVFGTEFHTVVKRHMPSLLQGAEALKNIQFHV